MRLLAATLTALALTVAAPALVSATPALTFESSLVVVPEPDTLSALALGLLGLMGLAMVGNRPRAAVQSPSSALAPPAAQPEPLQP